MPCQRDAVALPDLFRHVLEASRPHTWLSTYDIKRLKELEHENGRLRRMYPDLSLENAALQDVLAKKTLRPVKRQAALRDEVGHDLLPIQRACQAVWSIGRGADSGLSSIIAASPASKKRSGGTGATRKSISDQNIPQRDPFMAWRRRAAFACCEDTRFLARPDKCLGELPRRVC